jgi:hypothetical protein
MFVNDHMIDAFESYIQHGDDLEHKSPPNRYISESTPHSCEDKKKWSKEVVPLEWSYPPLRMSDKITTRVYEITVKMRVKHLTEKAVLFEPVVFFEHCGKHFHFVSNVNFWLPKSTLDVVYSKASRAVVYHKRLEHRSEIESEIDVYVLNNYGVSP